MNRSGPYLTAALIVVAFKMDLKVQLPHHVAEPLVHRLVAFTAHGEVLHPPLVSLVEVVEGLVLPVLHLLHQGGDPLVPVAAGFLIERLHFGKRRNGGFLFLGQLHQRPPVVRRASMAAMRSSLRASS